MIMVHPIPLASKEIVLLVTSRDPVTLPPPPSRVPLIWPFHPFDSEIDPPKNLSELEKIEVAYLSTLIMEITILHGR